MAKQYTHDKKKALASKISSIKRKEDLVNIFKIIYEENKSYTENNYGLFLIFDKLSENAYNKIDKYLKLIDQRKVKSESNLSETASTEKREYHPYTEDEFPGQSGISPKLKFSNKEKNIIKRRLYDNTLNQQNQEGSLYYEFNTDSDKGIRIK